MNTSLTPPERPLSGHDLERLARKRAGAKLGWIIHACAYVSLNLLFALLSVRHGRTWAVYPALGWGLGLLLHGAAVWLTQPGSRWYGRWVEREKQALRRTIQPDHAAQRSAD